MKGALWAWIMQRISAVILIVLVGFHFSIMHFVDPTLELDFALTTFRFKSLLYFIVDGSLLLFGIFHGLNGIRNIMLDYWPKAGRAITWSLGLLGLLFVGYGSLALFAFLGAN